MSDKKLLKNCPFCGGENIIQTYTNFVPSLLCSGCGARMIAPMDCFGKDYEKLLADKWNTRVPMQKIVERLEEEKTLSVKALEYAANHNWLQFDEAKGYLRGIVNAIEFVKEEGGLNES